MDPVEEPSGLASRASQSSDRPIKERSDLQLVVCYLQWWERSRSIAQPVGWWQVSQ